MSNLFEDAISLISQMKNIFTDEMLTLLILLIMLFRSVIVETIFNFILSIIGIKKDIKKESDTKTLKIYIFIVGLYLLATIWIKDDSFMEKATLIYKIISIITVSRLLAEILSPKGLVLRVLDAKSEKDIKGTILTNKFVSIIIEMVIYMVGVFIIITELGYNINGLVAGLGVGSAIIALALQDLVKSVVSGASILSEKPFITGDYIEVGTNDGTVEDITLRNTVIRSLDNSLISIPNSMIISETVKNWSKVENRYIRMKILVPIEMDRTKMERVLSKLRYYFRNNPKVVPNTEMVCFNQITTGGLELFIYCYITEVKYIRFLQEKERMNIEILEILKTEDASPVYDVKDLRGIEDVKNEKIEYIKED